MIRASKKRVEVRIRRVRHYVREVAVLKHKIHVIKRELRKAVHSSRPKVVHRLRIKLH